MTTFRRALVGASTTLVLGLALSACGDDDHSMMSGSGNGSMMGSTSSSSSPGAKATPATGAHNDADVSFASEMVPHHQQAIVMADMALRMGTSEDFVALAKAIKAAQAPEIAQMQGWLTGWGEDPAGTDHGAMGHDMGSMGGMMSDDDLTALEGTPRAKFEGMWLTMMIEHHEGAVEMSRTELTEGSNAEAKKLARSIIDSQTAEIATMEAMLAG